MRSKSLLFLKFVSGKYLNKLYKVATGLKEELKSLEMTKFLAISRVLR